MMLASISKWSLIAFITCYIAVIVMSIYELFAFRNLSVPPGWWIDAGLALMGIGCIFALVSFGAGMWQFFKVLP